MSNYILTTINQQFIAETIAATGSEQLLDKAGRNFVGLYDEQENWYIPLRANLSKKSPEGSHFKTPFQTNNRHFKRPGLDFQKALFVPKEMIIPIRNTLPEEQAIFIKDNQEQIMISFERYILSLESLSPTDYAYQFSTVPLFPEGIEKIKQQVKQMSREEENRMMETKDKKIILSPGSIAEKDDITPNSENILPELTEKEQFIKEQHERFQRDLVEIEQLAEQLQVDFNDQHREEIQNMSSEQRARLVNEMRTKSKVSTSKEQSQKQKSEQIFEI